MLFALVGGAAAHAGADAAVSQDLVVTPEGRAHIAGRSFRCAIGRGGICVAKREGDGVTPAGQWPLRHLLYRPDRLARPRCVLPVRALVPNAGWCDEPGDINYNRPVTRPYPASNEQLWRIDHVYDLILVVGYNDEPVVPGRGSAIFLHIARENYAPTAGCVAFARNDLLAILRTIDRGSKLIVQA